MRDRWRRLRLHATAAVTITVAWLALATLRLDRTRRLLRRFVPAPGAPPGTVAGAVRAVDRRLPLPTSCLERATTTAALLRADGREPALRLGVAPSGEFEAHAWVELDGRVVIGDTERLDEYARLDRDGLSP